MGLYDGQSGEVPVMPQPKTGFVGDVILEFKPPFSIPPVILATVNNGPPSEYAPLSFASTASVVSGRSASTYRNLSTLSTTRMEPFSLPSPLM